MIKPMISVCQKCRLLIIPSLRRRIESTLYILQRLSDALHPLGIALPTPMRTPVCPRWSPAALYA